MAAKRIVAVDLGGTKVAAALVSASGKLFSRTTVSVDTSSSSAPVEQITHLVHDLVGAKRLRDNVSAIGVAVPGLVRRDGTVWAPNLNWQRMPLGQRLKRALRLPVIVESDRNAAVLGETWRGTVRGKTDVIVVMLGTGIGVGILSGGRLIRGAHELSGCMGWMVVTDTYGREARQVGQLESLAAGPAIARIAASKAFKRVAGKPLNAYDVAEAARRGDTASRNAYLEAGRMLGYGVANLVSLFDPQIVVIGGGLAKASDLFLDALKATMRERAQPISGKLVRVVTSRLGGDANLLGVARLATDVNSSKAHPDNCVSVLMTENS